MTIDISWVWSWLASGMVVTALTALVLRLLPGVSASHRSVIWAGLLGAMPLLAGLLMVDASSLLAFEVAVVPSTPLAPATSTAAPSRLLTALVLAWVAVAVVRLAGVGVGLVTLRRWRARCRVLPASALDHLPAWRGLRDGGRRAAVAWSPDVATPCVLGLWSPIIALPRAAATLTPATLDAVLVHEYAHVQRRDDLAQLIQHVIRAICAIHPAVWWIDRQLTIEREAACDDWVVALAASPRAYARCLVSLASAQGLARLGLQVSARSGRSQLAARVRRLVDARRARRLAAARTVVAAMPAVIATMVVTTLACLAPTTFVSTPEAPDQPARSQAATRASAWRGLAMPATLTTATTSVARVHHASASSASSASAPSATLRPPSLPPSPRPDAVPRGTALPVPRRLVTQGPALVSVALAPAVSGADVPPGSRAGRAASAPPAMPSYLQGQGLGTPFLEAGTAVGQGAVSVGDAGREAGQAVARGGAATGHFFAKLGTRLARSF